MKLIILNGTGGAGKTTVAKRIHEDLPFSVIAPNYEIRRMISGFKKDRDRSRTIMFNLIYGVAEQALSSGSDVIIDSKIHDTSSKNSFVDRLISLGKDKGANTYEIILKIDKETSIARIRSRGFSEGAILNEENLEDNVDMFLEKMEGYTASRENASIIEASGLSPDEVYEEVCKIVGL